MGPWDRCTEFFLYFIFIFLFFLYKKKSFIYIFSSLSNLHADVELPKSVANDDFSQVYYCLTF